MAIITHTNARAEDGLASVGDTHNGCVVKFMRFVGRGAHAGSAPHLGINALKAAQIALHAIDANRETFRDDDTIRVHPIVTRGGEAVSAVPADVRLETFVRGKTVEAIADAARKVDRSLRAGAQAMGARVRDHDPPGLPAPADGPEPGRPAPARTAPPSSARRTWAGPATRPGPPTSATSASSCRRCIRGPAASAGTIHGADYVVVDHVLAAVNPAKAMAMTVVDLLADGAREARRVKAEAGPKLSREEYLALVRRFGSFEEYPEA